MLGQYLPERPITFPDGTIRAVGRPSPTGFVIWESCLYCVDLYIRSANNESIGGRVDVTHVSPDVRRLFNDVIASIEAECWKDVARRTGEELVDDRIKVFISYRRRSDIENFAESLAARLEQERLTTFFDKWDVVAGDSLPGKIEEAFETSRACIIVLSKDYKSGQWATQEMRTAISKRVTQGYRIIPALFEDCEVPELLKDAVRVDFRAHDADQFESQVREIIQALFGLTRRPYR
jgi:hypothetical protein